MLITYFLQHHITLSPQLLENEWCEHPHFKHTFKIHERQQITYFILKWTPNPDQIKSKTYLHGWWFGFLFELSALQSEAMGTTQTTNVLITIQGNEQTLKKVMPLYYFVIFAKMTFVIRLLNLLLVFYVFIRW